MSHSFHDDTQPNIISPYHEPIPAWRRLVGLFSLLGAMAFTTATILLIVTAPSVNATDVIESDVTESPAEISAVVELPTDVPATDIPVENSDNSISQVAMAQQMPTISAELINTMLSTPMNSPDQHVVFKNTGLNYDPFTISPNRARAKMTSYTAVRGDTIDSIAQRFGIERETIAWCNNYRLALVLRPGDAVTIPPTNGACHTVLASQGKTIIDIAAQYGVTDPYRVIDSPANNLPDISPETLLPSGTFLFIPGGQGPIITWDAPVEQDAAGNVIAFAPGQAGSCGSVAGGGTFWTNPLPNGTWMRGFYAGHSGIDLSASEGTPIVAANGGPVLYAGWNSWGYGNTVVIGHGPFSTLYGHMSGTAVSCGATVSAGQVIGYVGSTGNSSGPHLHFEIRYQNVPQDPSLTVSVGW